MIGGNLLSPCGTLGQHSWDESDAVGLDLAFNTSPQMSIMERSNVPNGKNQKNYVMISNKKRSELFHNMKDDMAN